MTVAGWIFLAVSFGWLIPAVVVMCLYCWSERRRIRREARARRQQRQANSHPDTVDRSEYLVIRTPRAIHCLHLPTETERFIASIYAQADQEQQR